MAAFALSTWRAVAGRISAICSGNSQLRIVFCTQEKAGFMIPPCFYRNPAAAGQSQVTPFYQRGFGCAFLKYLKNSELGSRTITSLLLRKVCLYASMLRQKAENSGFL